MNKSRKQLFFSGFMKKRFLPTCFMASLAVVNAYAENNFVLNQEGHGVSVPMSMQQSKQLTGVVMDVNNVPIIGANIRIKGTTEGTITDLDGKFSVSCTPNANIQISYIGYKTAEFVVGNNKSITIVLKEDFQSLDEVVVVGFGTQKKVNLTGSVSTIGSDELQGVPATNVASMMQGKMPGVAITQGSGQPGHENNTIRIRGVGTMNNSEPMVLVDGLESSLNDVNPNDIENISVLKDAAAASIYGTRAANGVILITTKRGIVGTPKISYNGYVGVQEAIRTLQHLSSAQYAELLNEGLRNENLDPVYTSEEIEKFANGTDPDNYPNTQWLDLLLKGNGLTHNHNLSLTGGTKETRYAVSLGYYNQSGLMENMKHDRYSVRMNLDSDVTKWLSFGINSSMSYRNIDQPTNPYQGGVNEFFRQANRIPNTYVNKYQDGSWGRHIDGNPLAWIDSGGKSTSQYAHVLGSAFAEVKIMDGLTLKGIAGLDWNLDDGKTHIREVQYGDGSKQGPNSVEDYLARWKTVTLQAFLNYSKSWKNNNIKGMLGVSREAYKHNLTKAYRKSFPNNELNELDGGSINGWSNSGTMKESFIGSYFGRINYDYAGKYLFEANLRIDGSSKFAKNNRWGYFPSFSAGWRLSEEGFLKKDWLRNLKIRGSWGKLGNHRIYDYQHIALITLGENYNFGNIVTDGAVQTIADNANITWETTTELNLGVDLDVFDGLFSLNFDYYNRYTDNILAKVPGSYIYGLDAPITNVGAMRNSGVEIILGHRNTINNFHYNLNGYMAINKNEVEKYPNPSKGDYIKMEGIAWNSFYGYECIGIFQSDDEAKNSPVHSPSVRAGDLKFRDQNGDKKIDAEDRVVLGNSMPNITYGFNLNLGYKDFDLNASFQGVADACRTVGGESFWGYNLGSNAQEKHLDRTIVENGKVVKEGYYPRRLINQKHNGVMSSFMTMNSSFLRLKNLQLGYNLPKTLLSKIPLEKARVYVSGQNLFTFTKFLKDYDPEGGGAYPQVAIYTFGLDITF